MTRPVSGRAPSVTLPLRYLLAATAAFVLAALAVPFLAVELAGHYYHPRLLAVTHLVTLGWITLAIMGASVQVVPIVLERTLWSERLARWQFLAALVGMAGMVSHFALGEWRGLVWAAGLVALAVALHLLNVALTLRGLSRWIFTARLLILALAGLALTVLAGLALAANHVWPWLPVAFYPALHAHVHLALLGFVLPMVAGVAARVYPMFLLGPEPGDGVARIQLWGLALGVPAVVAGLLLDRTLLVAGALAVGAAVAAHVGSVTLMVRRRKRPALDWGLRLVLTGTAFLVPASLLGLGLAFDLVDGPRPALAYVILTLGGWVSLTIAGMLLKIVPFLVWSRAHAPRAGREPVPTLAQLSPAWAEGAAWALLTGGIVALTGAVAVGDVVLIRVGGLGVAAGALTLGATLGRVVLHLRSRAHPSPVSVLVEGRVP
jgi:hypothetical protein